VPAACRDDPSEYMAKQQDLAAARAQQAAQNRAEAAEVGAALGLGRARAHVHAPPLPLWHRRLWQQQSRVPGGAVGAQLPAPLAARPAAAPGGTHACCCTLVAPQAKALARAQAKAQARALTKAQAQAQARALTKAEKRAADAASRAQQRIRKQAARLEKMAAALLLEEAHAGGSGGGSAEGDSWQSACVRPGEALAGLLACYPDVLRAEAGPLVRVQQAAAGGMQVYLAGGQGLELIPPAELAQGLPDDLDKVWGKGWWVGEGEGEGEGGEREYELLAHWGTVGQAVLLRSSASWRRLQVQVHECSLAAMAVEEQAYDQRQGAAASAAAAAEAQPRRRGVVMRRLMGRRARFSIGAAAL
jgi:hypothetical protein